MISAKKSLLSTVIASTFVILPSISYADEFTKSAQGIIKRGTVTALPIDKNVQGNLEQLGVDPDNASLIADTTKAMKSASANVSLLNNSLVVTKKAIDSLATKNELLNKFAKLAKNPNLANELSNASSQISGRLGQATNMTRGAGKFAGNVTRVVSVGEWGINMINSTANFINNDNKELTDYTDIAMDAMSVTLIGGLSRDYIYKPIKGIGKANEEINDNKAKQVAEINKQVMRYIQGNAIAANIEHDLSNQKLDYSNMSNSELDNYLANKISQEANKIDEVVVHLEKTAEMLKQKDAVFFFWNVDAGKYLAQSVGDYIYTLERHKERILNNKSERYNQYKDILIASISKDLLNQSTSELASLDNDIKGLVRDQKKLYADMVEIHKQQLTISQKLQKNISNKENKSYTPDLNEANSSNKNFKPKANKVDNLAIKQEILKKHGIDTSAQDTQDNTVQKVVDKGTPSSGENSNDVAELKTALFALMQTNKKLFDEYKDMKLDLEKAKWNDLYHASATSQSISSKAAELNNNVDTINRYRGILDGNNNLSTSDKAATIPLTANGHSLNTYVNSNIATYKAANDKAVADKIAGIEKSLANTKATANYHSLEYSKLLKDIEKVRNELKAAGFKPTEANKKVVADSKNKINKWKAEAEENRLQANIYNRKKLMEEQQLDYAKIDKYHYDGKQNSYQLAKSGLDQAYVGKKPHQIAKEPLDTSYNELMAILGQPIVVPTIPETPETPETPKSEIRTTVLVDNKDTHTSYHQFDITDGKFYKNDSGDYQHLSWGTWKGNDSTDFETIHVGHYVEGQATVNLPTSGTASYKGNLSGDFKNFSTQTWEHDVLSGDVQLTANFNEGSIAIGLDIYKDGQAFEKINGTTDIHTETTRNFFAYDDIEGDDGRVVSGMFYGPHSEEAGGTWSVFKPAGTAIGSFRAKQTTQDIEFTPDEKPHDWQGFYTSARRVQSDEHGIFFFSDATNVDTHNPITNGTVEIENRSRNDRYTVNVDYGDYQYVAWGEWGDNHPKGGVFNKLVYGKSTPPSDLPRIGSASYIGDLQGDYMNTATGAFEQSAITGNIALTANFSKQQISGIMNAKHNGKPWATADIKPAEIKHNQYHAHMEIADNKGGGSIIGGFYGPNANEAAGVFTLDKRGLANGSEHAAGIFRAKKQ